MGRLFHSLAVFLLMPVLYWHDRRKGVADRSGMLMEANERVEANEPACPPEAPAQLASSSAICGMWLLALSESRS